MSCSRCKFQRRSNLELPCLECTGNRAIDYFKPMTNADRMRNMDDDELAEFLLEVNNTIPHCMFVDCKYDDEREGLCKNCFLEWLKAEVEGDE